MNRRDRGRRRPVRPYEAVIEGIEGSYLDHIGNFCGVQDDSLLTALNSCIHLLKDGRFEMQNDIVSMIVKLKNLLDQKIIETGRIPALKDVRVPIPKVVYEPSVTCRFCGDAIQESKLQNHQKNDCKRLNVQGLTLTEPRSESLFRIIWKGIVCSLCDIVCTTIAEKVSHCESFSHLSRTQETKSRVFNTIYCIPCHETLPNNNVQCYDHIQSEAHKRFQIGNRVWYSEKIRYHSFLNCVRCISCKQNIYDATKILEHHNSLHIQSNYHRSLCNVWCQFCKIEVSVESWEAHFSQCDRLPFKAFYCQLCNATVRGGVEFVLHVKTCEGVSMVNEMDLREAFCESLTVVNTPAEQPSRSLMNNIQPEESSDSTNNRSRQRSRDRRGAGAVSKDRNYSNTSSTTFTSEMNLWCNCCGYFCRDLKEHYAESCRPVINDGNVSVRSPSGRTLFTITHRGIICNCCQGQLISLQCSMLYHDNDSHIIQYGKQPADFIKAFIFCAVCQDFIPTIAGDKHIESGDHATLNLNFRSLRSQYTYLLLFLRYRCLSCKKNLFTHKQLIDHQEASHSSTPYAYVWCQSCNESVTVGDVAEHIKGDVHKEWKTRHSVCLLCQENVVGYKNLLSHVRRCRTLSHTNPSSASWTSTQTPSSTHISQPSQQSYLSFAGGYNNDDDDDDISGYYRFSAPASKPASVNLFSPSSSSVYNTHTSTSKPSSSTYSSSFQPNKPSVTSYSTHRSAFINNTSYQSVPRQSTSLPQPAPQKNKCVVM